MQRRASIRSAAGMPAADRIAGWIPREISRSSSLISIDLGNHCVEFAANRLVLGCRVRCDPEAHRECDQALLSTVVQIPFDAATCRIRCGDDSRSGCVELGSTLRVGQCDCDQLGEIGQLSFGIDRQITSCGTDSDDSPQPTMDVDRHADGCAQASSPVRLAARQRPIVCDTGRLPGTTDRGRQPLRRIIGGCLPGLGMRFARAFGGENHCCAVGFISNHPGTAGAQVAEGLLGGSDEDRVGRRAIGDKACQAA